MGDSITRLGAPLVSNPVPPDTEENRRCGMLSELADTGDSLDTGTAAHSALLNALRELSSCKQSARAVIDFCRALEASGAFPADANVRETITGPIMDAVFAGSTGLRKVLESGLVYNFDYTSKIARDLLLGEDHPDHVFEPQTTRLLLHLARGATHVLIGGAYGGDHALLVAQQIAGKGGICYAFEPNPEQINTLRRNAKANRLTNIQLIEAGLWSDDCTRLTLVGDDALGRSEPASGAAGSVSGMTINRFGREHAIKNLDVIMLDIEGSELQALRGASDYLRQPPGTAPSVIFEVHRRYVDWSNGLDSTPVVRLLRDHGYQVFAIRDFQSNVDMRRCKIELVPPHTAYLEGPPHGFNMLAIKDKQQIAGDLFRVVEGVSPKLLRHRDPALHYPTEWR
ncbi:MAG TPA: FkbM family methyltransferase [Terriglobales bacterium]|nr:FkbM family methyltransferase [Terriglobales bacterium]